MATNANPQPRDPNRKTPQSDGPGVLEQLARDLLRTLGWSSDDKDPRRVPVHVPDNRKPQA